MKHKQMKIIPAIDIIGGKCVRLTQGDYADCTVYSENPLDIAIQFEEAGLKRLHLVDLDGAKSNSVINFEVLKHICSKTSLIVDFSGGIKSDDDLKKVYDLGATYAGIGSLAQSDRKKTEAWLSKYGGDSIIIGADISNGMIAIHGWKTITETSIDELISWYEGELVNLMCTDIAKDGMLQGASVSLYEELCKKYPNINIIASGGVGTIQDLDPIAKTGASGIVIGKAIYENKITLEQLIKWRQQPKQKE